MTIKEIYIADDGTEFDDMEECLMYDKELSFDCLRMNGIRAFDNDFIEPQNAEEITYFHVFNATQDNYEVLSKFFKAHGVCFEVDVWRSGTYKYNYDNYKFENITKICIDMETQRQAVLKAVEVDQTK